MKAYCPAAIILLQEILKKFFSIWNDDNINDFFVVICYIYMHWNNTLEVVFKSAQPSVAADVPYEGQQLFIAFTAI